MTQLAQNRGDTAFDKMRGLLENPNTLSQFKNALPKVGVDAKQFARMAITTLSQNPDLLQCEPASILRCLVLSAQYGLPPTGRGGMWLVKYGRTCTPIIDWRGLMEIARRSGHVTRIMANCVHRGDVFEYEEGSEPFLKHRKTADSTSRDEDVTHVYAVAHLKDGPAIFRVMTRLEIEQTRSRSKASSRGPWVTDWQAMARKTVVRRLCEFLPMQSSDQRLLEMVAHEEAGMDLGGFMPTVDVPADVADADEPETEAGTGYETPPEGGYSDDPF